MFRDCQFIKCGTNVVMGASYQGIFENVLSANSYMMLSGGDAPLRRRDQHDRGRLHHFY